MSFGAATITEQMSESPTRTPSNVQNDPGITPGGLDPANNVPTLGKMQSGSFVGKLVCAIEGCKYLLSQAPAAATLAAWANASGGDWTDVLGGVFVDLRVSQSIAPDEPFPAPGKCRISVMDTDGTDTFGIYVHKRNTGDKTTLTATADRNDTTLNVASSSGFTSPDTAYLGTEAFGYTGTTSTSFTGATRGKYSPLGCDSSGSGGQRFPRHNRVSTDPNTTLSNPVVSEVPRNWLGKYVTIHLHTWSEEDQQLNMRERAQLVYAGRIVSIQDNPDTMCTDIEVEHIAQDFKDGVVFRDQFCADITDGINLLVGRTFKFRDFMNTGTGATAGVAQDLVVTTGATGAYQIEPGYYDGYELAGLLSRWLAQAKTDLDILGYYSVAYNVSSNVGPRSKVYWQISDGSAYNVSWRMSLPGEVAAFLGFAADEDDPLGQTSVISVDGAATNEMRIKQSEKAPYRTMVFKPYGPGSAGHGIFGDIFTEWGVLAYQLENVTGTFVDQYSLMPAIVRSRCPSGLYWSFFLLDDKSLIVAAYDSTTHAVTNCWLAPFQMTADNAADAVMYIGRRVDEPPAPVTLRQIIIAEGPLQSMINQFVYSTGVAGMNHSIWDTLPATMGLAIPGSTLGPKWERSLANLPGANDPIAVVLDRPTKFADLLRDDFRIRRTFIRWHDQGFEFSTWRTPLVDIAEATLSESNKASPAGTQDNHRIASLETDQWHYPVVKIKYCRDFSGRDANYLKSIQLEDQGGADSAGNSGRSLTLEMRNTFPMFANTGAAVEKLIPEFMAGMSMFSRPSRMVTRTIDLRYFETIAPGMIVVLEDVFARDPLSGVRGTTRAAIVTKVSYDLGGPVPRGSSRPMTGEVELFYLDTHRGGLYSPAAEVNDEANYAGFSAGYNASTKQLWLKKNAYSFIQQIDTKRGPVNEARSRDAGWFDVGDEVTVCEIDPTDTASPTSWTDTIAAVSGDWLTLTTGLAGWSASKKYRVFAQTYSACTATQRDYVFQADVTDEMIEDQEVADHFCATSEPVTFVTTSLADKAELVADLTWGDGKPQDPGADAALGFTNNAWHDYKSAHQQPVMTASAAVAGLTGNVFPISNVQMIIPFHFGFDHLSTTVTKSLTTSLWFRSSSAGVTAEIRATLTRSLPTSTPSAEGDPTGGYFGRPMFPAESATSQTYSTTSTTWGQTADFTLPIDVKDLSFGMAYLVIECSGACETRGTTKMIEGPRTQP